MEVSESSQYPKLTVKPTEVSLNLHEISSLSAEPPPPPTVRYYYSNVVAKNVSYIYRVVEEGELLVCYPEARGWPRLTFASAKELDENFSLLVDQHIVSEEAHLRDQPGQVRFPNLEELGLNWQVGSNVQFRHCDVRTAGKVVGRFVWRTPYQKRNLRFVLLLQMLTNELILSTQVTDLVELDQSVNKEEVYIHGISLISVVATLIANVAYLASLSPIRGIDESKQGIAVASYLSLPKVFLFFNAFAFYASVLAVVLMTAFIPVYGTAGEWGAIFLSGSVPVVLSLVAFYVAYIVSAWAVLDSWGTSLGITVVGILMVVYVRFWAIELMHGNVDKNLEIAARSNPWDWYYSRLEPGCEINLETAAHQSLSASKRFSKALSRVPAKIREFLLSPTIWQLSVLGTVPESKKSSRKRKFLFEHLEKSH